VEGERERERARGEREERGTEGRERDVRELAQNPL
jgi:hypothetical protein